MLTPFHGYISKNEDGTLDFQPGLLETEGMQRAGHEEAGFDKGAKDEGKEERPKKGKL